MTRFIVMHALAALAGWTTLPAGAQVRPSDPVPRLRQMLEARDYPGAERSVKEELARSPAWDAGHLLLARIYLETARYELAERAAGAAVRIRESVDGFMLLALATMRQNRLNDSIGWLEKAARIRPDHAEIYKLLGLDYALGGALGEAEKAFARAVQLGPAGWENHYYLGRAQFERGRLHESRASFERALELNGASVKAWTALGQVRERVEGFEAAQESYTRAISACGAGPDCAWPFLQLGYLMSTSSNPDSAIDFFRKAVETRPDWARAHFHLGKALASSGDLERARDELELAIRLDQSQSEYHYQLAQVYRGLGEDRKATAEFALFRKLADLESHVKPAREFAEP